MNKTYDALEIAKYDASEVAKQIITRCKMIDVEVSNLKLQKLLYFVWLDFYRETRKYLFSDAIEAWQFGPVVPNVYEVYKAFSSLPIKMTFEVQLNEKDISVMNEIIDKYAKFPTSYLVDITHKEGTPWSNVYANGKGNHSVIDFDLIVKEALCVNE